MKGTITAVCRSACGEMIRLRIGLVWKSPGRSIRLDLECTVRNVATREVWNTEGQQLDYVSSVVIMFNPAGQANHRESMNVRK